MNNEINYKNNPLHGLSLKNLLIELVDHYGYEILFAYLSINCFKTNPSIESSVKFLKKTDWAREKVEVFYLYEFRNFPRASSEQFQLSPRDRIIPEGQTSGEPAELSFDDADRLREKREKKAAERGQGAQRGKHSNKRERSHSREHGRESSNAQGATVESDSDPWAKWKGKS